MPKAVAARDARSPDVMACAEVDGQWLTGCSNDYLGLAQQFSVVNALQDAAAREGAGAGARTGPRPPRPA